MMNVMYKSNVCLHAYMFFVCSMYALVNVNMYAHTSFLLIYNVKVYLIINIYIYICMYISTSIFVL